MTEAVATRLQSGFQSTQDSGAGDYATGEIRAANETLLQRTGLQLELPVAVLAEQRDNALRWYVYERTRSEQLQAEHQRELEALRQAHQTELEALRQAHQRELEPLARQRRAELEAPHVELTGAPPTKAAAAASASSAVERGLTTTLSVAGAEARMMPGGHASTASEAPSSRASVVVRSGDQNLLGEIVADDYRKRVTELEQQRLELESLIKAASAEAEETRRDALRIQSERDEALAAADDIRLQMQTDLDAARDEHCALQAQLDETRRDAEDARDQAQLEMMRLGEELSELREALAKALGA